MNRKWRAGSGVLTGETLGGNYISLPGIGEYRVPIIFDNKKSNFSIKNLNHSITALLIFFPGAVEPYFSLEKKQRSKFAKFILKLTF